MQALSSRWAPALVAAVVTGAFAIWNPPLRDLAAHTFRAEYFEQHGFAIWNNTWYGGHYLPAYSVLFPPLAALLTPVWVGAASAVASAHLFDGLVRARWGERARWAGLWFAALGAVALLANGWLVFALGAAFALGALRALQLGHMRLAIAAAVGAALSSPVAAVFLGLIAIFGGLVPGRGRRAVAVTLAVALPLGILGLLFPEGGEFPFWFSAYWPLALFCVLALLAIRGIDHDRDVRAVLAVYLALATLDWLIPSPFGGNITRLGALFGGPVLLALLLARAPQRVRAPVAVAALVMGLAWQVVSPFRQVTESLDDPSTARSYYEPVKAWLSAHGAQGDRIEIPQTFNHWEAAYVAPDFSIARGWLRQLDRERNRIFYDGREPTHARYRRWLHDNGIRWVAASDARLDYSAVDEDRLVRQDPPYLRLRARLAHWDVYEVIDSLGVLSPAGGGSFTIFGHDPNMLRPESFSLGDVLDRGRWVVRVRWSPYWHVQEGSACIGKAGDWTLVRVDEPGTVRVSMRFSAGAARRAALGQVRRC
jgi:hypothetical protein